MVVSINGGTSKSSIFGWDFPYEPSILGYPHGHGNPQMGTSSNWQVLQQTLFDCQKALDFWSLSSVQDALWRCPLYWLVNGKSQFMDSDPMILKLRYNITPFYPINIIDHGCIVSDMPRFWWIISSKSNIMKTMDVSTSLYPFRMVLQWTVGVQKTIINPRFTGEHHKSYVKTIINPMVRNIYHQLVINHNIEPLLEGN